MFVTKQNGFGRDKVGFIWVASGVCNLYYQMTEWMIVVLNEQLLTLIDLVWSGSQC